jgi:hypothetical protein
MTNQPLTVAGNENTYYRVVKNGRGRKPTIEVYRFYPEVGPKGTAGRGPYCISWLTVKTEAVAAIVESLEASSIRALPEGE